MTTMDAQDNTNFTHTKLVRFFNFFSFYVWSMSKRNDNRHRGPGKKRTLTLYRLYDDKQTKKTHTVRLLECYMF